MIMEYYNSPIVSTHPQAQDHSYNYMSQNLDLGYSSSSRNNFIGALNYSCYSPRPLRFDQSSAVHEPLFSPVPCVPRSFVDTNTFSDQGQTRTNLAGWPSMYNEANQVPGISVPSTTIPAYGPSYIGGATTNPNGGCGQAFTPPRSDGQNGKRTQAFTETRNNGQSGASLPNPQETVPMAMRNEGWMVLQNSVLVELVLCMRVMSDLLVRALPQVEANDLPLPTRSKRIFVGGLASTVTERDLEAYFYQFGTVTNVQVMYDHITRMPRGFGFITFDTEEAVDRVLHRTSFHELNGKMAEVKRAIPKNTYRKSIRGQLGVLNYGLSSVSHLLRAYTQGSNPGQAGGSGLKPDGRASPAAVSRSGYPSFSPRYGPYGAGPNFEPAGGFW